MNENELNYSVNEKLKSFTNMALREAHRRKKELIDQTQKLKAEELKKREIELLEDAYHSIQTGTRQNRRELNEEISKALVEGKKKLFDKRREIIEDVFKMVDDKLEQYKKSDEYRTFILREMKKCDDMLSDEEYVLEADPDEIGFLSEIAKEAGLKFETRLPEKPIEGGFILYGKNKNMRGDCSLSTRREEARDDFLEICEIPIDDGDLLNES